MTSPRSIGKIIVFATSIATGSTILSAAPPILLDGTKVITIGDYPQAALANEWFGINSARIHVLPDGRPESCVITESTGSPTLDKRTCKLFMSRARFSPATDAAGVPIASDFRISNAWGVGDHMPSTRLSVPLTLSHLPQGYKNPVESIVIFDSSGRASSCETTKTSGDEKADRAACDYLKATLAIDAPTSGSKDIPAAAVRYVSSVLTEQAKP